MWLWITDHSKLVLGLLAAFVWLGAIVWYIVICNVYKNFPTIAGLFRGWRDRRFDTWNDPKQ